MPSPVLDPKRGTIEIPKRLPISGAKGSERLIRLQERMDYLKEKIDANPDFHYAIAEFAALRWAINVIITYEDQLN